MSPKYNNIEQIRYDLKVHSLERQIAMEKLKQSGHAIKEVANFPTHVVSSVLSSKYVKALALIRLLRKIF
ncbi:hypothetical protein [Aestuariibaculum sediminum]|uniref:Uncharacterized protein n=1 Tax=Aestuariibaculum sediminum TaxID=2770637 RepID=A0A8J6Q184_9FLAO|nr:hypothetical protein [Aestuariibaculum sediminum]MBD0830854.1 hypothetical protein [Aestuariibaculum sediminum]